MGRNATYAMVMKRQSTETAQNLILDEVTPQCVPGRRPRTSPPPIEASKLGVNMIEPVMLMTELFADLSRRKSIETLQEGTVLNAPQIVPGRNPRMNVPTVKASNVELNVFAPAIPMAEVHEELDEVKLLSEINEHMAILLDPYGRTTGVRPSPVEALALIMVMIVDETDLPVDGIVKGNAPTTMSEMGILMDLEWVVSRCTPSTTITASTVRASGVVTNPNAMSTV